MEIRLMTWRSLVVAVLTGTLMSSAAYALGPSTQPSGASAGGSLQFKASEAFNRGQYAAALPLFQKLLEQSKDRPDEVGPIQEKIRVCQTAIAKATADQANQPNQVSS